MSNDENIEKSTSQKLDNGEEGEEEENLEKEKSKSSDKSDNKSLDETQSEEQDKEDVPVQSQPKIPEPAQVVKPEAIEKETTSQIVPDDEQKELVVKKLLSGSYLESDYEKRPEVCCSLRSIYPPCSWPSSAQLSKDSDVYPKASEYSIEIENGLTLIRTASTVGRDESHFDIHEVLPTFQAPVTLVVPQKQKIETKAITPVEKVASEIQENVERFKMTDVPFLRDVFKLPVTKDIARKICFSETLLISYEFNDNYEEYKEYRTEDTVIHKSQLLRPEGVQEMGGMNVNIEKSYNSIITFCTTQFSCLGSAGASRILSVVDYEFGLVEEKKTEWHCRHDKKIEKTLHVAKEGDGFLAFRTDSEDEKVEKHRGEVALNATGDLVLDGGLFALMRFLIITNFTGEFETWSMHITGEPCRCKFIVGKKKVIYINDIPYVTTRIKKELYREHRYPDVSKLYFLPSGHLVRQKWKGCRYFIHLNPIGRIPPKKHSVKHSWKDDIMLVSQYLDEKEKIRSETQTYLEDHPEIKNMLQDYMLCLLQLKPDHVLDFTIEYFVNLFRD